MSRKKFRSQIYKKCCFPLIFMETPAEFTMVNYYKNWTQLFFSLILDQKLDGRQWRANTICLPSVTTPSSRMRRNCWVNSTHWKNLEQGPESSFTTSQSKNKTTSQSMEELPHKVIVKLPHKVRIALPHKIDIKLPHKIRVKLHQEKRIKLPHKVTVKLPHKVRIKLPHKVRIKLPQKVMIKVSYFS